ncbi:hypothetical protein [Hymenobacter lapidiphilus]|uniref:Uncharacterized protein n=1 Tax=Hymenobacter lapidiphilus TaxID=2608003 RepID=A0A7Y7U4H2_9BACT|nr:hypothetical protein [Hymenobacter lapidiphilus]NVO29684.1 hypothetical protein [Hymenobacter lapidiphilus]
MFTALQFSQLAAAAWSGPAANISVSATHYVATCGNSAHGFSISYHLGGAMYYGNAQCPFEAVATAVAAAAAAGIPVSRHKAHRAIARTAAALCGLPSIRPTFASRARRRCVARRFYV